MNSNLPTPGTSGRGSKPVRSMGLAIRIVALMVAAAGDAALLLFLPRYPWTKAKNESAALVYKSKSYSVPSGLSRTGSRNDAEAAAAARAQSSGGADPAGRLTAAPTPYTLQLVNILCPLDRPVAPMTQEEAAQWKEHLQALVRQGPEAVPAIVEFLKRNKDLDFDPGTSEAIGYASARKAMFDAMLQIGGLEGVSGMLQTLQTTADPREIALLAQDLEKLEPEQHRQVAI